MGLAFVSKPRNIVREGAQDSGSSSEVSVASEIEAYLSKELGYIPFRGILRASSYGVPQNRDRLFIFAVRSDLASNISPCDINLFLRVNRLAASFIASKGLPPDRPVSVREALEDLDGDAITSPEWPKFKTAIYRPPVSTYSKLMRQHLLLRNIPDSHRFANHTPFVLEA